MNPEDRERLLADPHLHTLPAVLARHPDARLLRYRAGRRCTLQSTFDGRACIVKVFTDDRGAALHHDAASLWDARNRGLLRFEVAEPIGWDAELRVLMQALIRGTPAVPTLFGPDGLAIARAMGRAAASLPATDLAPAMVFDAKVQLARTRRYAKRIAELVPSCTAAVGQCMQAFDAAHEALPAQPARPIHGAPHPHQWLEGPAGLALVDFDRFSMGDPELDVATFIGEVEFERSTHHPVQHLNAAFVEGYEDGHGPLDADRLSLYVGHKRFAKAWRFARAARADQAHRVAEVLASVGTAIGGRWRPAHPVV